MKGVEIVTVSERFNASDADIILVSSDKTHFKVHRANLITHSVVFKTMIELADLNGAKDNKLIQECKLSESDQVLEIVLPYVYPEKVTEALDHSINNHKLGIRAFLKYFIWAGINDAAYFFMEGLQNPSCSTPAYCCNAYGFAISSEKPKLQKRALNAFLRHGPILYTLKNEFKGLGSIYSGACTQLRNEWGERTLIMLENHKQIGSKLDSNAVEHSSKNGCIWREFDDQGWLLLAGVASSTIFSKIMIDNPPSTDCTKCRKMILSAQEELFEKLKKLEVC